MDTLTHNPFDLSFNECADVDVVGFANGYESLMDLGLELRPHILAVEGHLRFGLIAKVAVELFNMADAWIRNFSPRDLHECAERYIGVSGHGRPVTFRRLELLHHIVVNRVFHGFG